MYLKKIKITNALGKSTIIDYIFADIDKILIDKNGNTVSYIEATKISDFIEIDFSPEAENEEE